MERSSRFDDARALAEAGRITSPWRVAQAGPGGDRLRIGRRRPSGPRRSLTDPSSLVGVTGDELLALKPAGWIARPLPGRAGGFRLLSPGKQPGADGIITFVKGGSPGVLRLAGESRIELRVLNAAAEHMTLLQLFDDVAAVYGEMRPDAIARLPSLIHATQASVHSGLVEVYRDPLEGDEIPLLTQLEAVRALADPLNWWRDERDPGIQPAIDLFALEVTDKGREALFAIARPR
jgi:hypothetical protein